MDRKASVAKFREAGRMGSGWRKLWEASEWTEKPEDIGAAKGGEHISAFDTTE